jgi:uncharacterized membrane protein YfcA
MLSINILEFSVLIWLGSLVAGLVGALTGLGGGALLVPLLTLAFNVDMRYAIGASLISVIAPSSGAAPAYVKEGFPNMHVGMFLEIATTLGALIGAFLAAQIPTSAIAVIGDTPQHAGGGQVMPTMPAESRPNLGRMVATRGGPVLT